MSTEHRKTFSVPDPLPRHASGGSSQFGLTVWLTGLSGSGKSTIARGASIILKRLGYKCELLDADEIRASLSPSLGYAKSDRDENVRRIGYIAELLTRNGVIVLVAAISPYRSVCEEVRQKIERFIEVFVYASIDNCETRDPRGLYRKARNGHLQGFTGVDDPYEVPDSPDNERVDESVMKTVGAILGRVHAI